MARTGRPLKHDEHRVTLALIDYLDGVPVKNICRDHDMHPATLYEHISKRSVPLRQRPELFQEASS